LERVAIASLMQHRLALLAARITVVPAEARSDAANLRQLRAALSIIDVRRASSVLSRRTRAVIDAFLAHLASVCRIHTVGRLPDELVGQLDRTIAFTLQESAGEAAIRRSSGLPGFARGFFRNRRHMNRRKSNTGQWPHEIRTRSVRRDRSEPSAWSVLAYFSRAP